MLYLVRHGQTDWNLEHRTQGKTDISLNDTGRAQARALAPQIVPLHIDRVISSDLSRARETAEILNELIHKPHTLDNRLREIDYGDFEGQIGLNRPKEEWTEFNLHPERFNGESMEHVFSRIKAFCEEQRDEDNLLVVAHGGAIRMMMYYAENPNRFDLDLFLNHFLHIPVANSGIYQWDKKNHFSQIRLLSF